MKMVKKLKYGGRNVKIVENIDFRLIWQFQEVVGQKLHSTEKYCHWLFQSKYMYPNTLIYFCFNFLEIFKKITLVNIFVHLWCPKVSVRDSFCQPSPEKFQNNFQVLCSRYSSYISYLHVAWKALEYIKWFR